MCVFVCVCVCVCVCVRALVCLSLSRCVCVLYVIVDMMISICVAYCYIIACFSEYARWILCDCVKSSPLTQSTKCILKKTNENGQAGIEGLFREWWLIQNGA